MSNTPEYDKLIKALTGGGTPYKAPLKFALATRRNKHSERLNERIQKNAEAADVIIDIIKSLVTRPGNEEDAGKLIDVAKILLDNNAKLREQVGDALRDIPN